MPLLLFIFGVFSASLASASTAINACPPSTISVRLPPYLDPKLNGSHTSSRSHREPSFVGPPLEFYTGTWYITNNSLPLYRSYSNLQWDVWPAFPTCTQNSTTDCAPGTRAGELVEFTSWALTEATINSTSTNRFDFGARGGGNRSVASIVGYHTPRRFKVPDLGPRWDSVFDMNITQGIPAGYTKPWAVLYWGVDAAGWPFMLVHEGAATTRGQQSSIPLMDAVSRRPTGPDQGSLTQVLEALVALGNQHITDLVKELGPVTWDYNLAGGSAICGKGCIINAPE
jgi:hypothetical protein